MEINLNLNSSFALKEFYENYSNLLDVYDKQDFGFSLIGECDEEKVVHISNNVELLIDNSEEISLMVNTNALGNIKYYYVSSKNNPVSLRFLRDFMTVNHMDTTILPVTSTLSRATVWLRNKLGRSDIYVTEIPYIDTDCVEYCVAQVGVIYQTASVIISNFMTQHETVTYEFTTPDKSVICPDLNTVLELSCEYSYEYDNKK